MSDPISSSNRNFNKTSKELAVEQIYQSTGYNVPANKVIFGVPSKLDQFPGVQSDENSFVPVIIDSLFDGSFDGDDGFMYRRLSIDVLDASGNVTLIPRQYPHTTHSILPQLNAILNTQLSEEDVINETFTDETTPFTLIAHPQSLAWINSKPLTISDSGKQFLFINPFLNGFNEHVFL